MPLNDQRGVDRFQREIGAARVSTFQQVQLRPEWFGPDPRPSTDVLFKTLDTGLACLVLVDARLEYSGGDPEIAAAFRNGESRGWRPLALIHSTSPQQVLRFADALLGLSGQPPHVPKRAVPRQRELVLGPEPVGGEVEDAQGARFGRCLVAEARAGRVTPPLFREREVAALIRVLSKAGKNAACLIGEPGVGKTAVVEGLAAAVAGGHVPEALRDARILDVNLSFLGAGASMRGEFEARIKELVELARRDRRTILFLDELHTVRASGSDASQMLKADLGRGRISCIGATTNAEWRQIEADGALARRFQVVRVDELLPPQALEILRNQKRTLERHHGVEIPDALLSQIVDLCLRHLPDRRLPDNALDLLDEAAACAATTRFNQGGSDERGDA